MASTSRPGTALPESVSAAGHHDNDNAPPADAHHQQQHQPQQPQNQQPQASQQQQHVVSTPVQFSSQGSFQGAPSAANAASAPPGDCPIAPPTSHSSLQQAGASCTSQNTLGASMGSAPASRNPSVSGNLPPTPGSGPQAPGGQAGRLSVSLSPASAAEVRHLREAVGNLQQRDEALHRKLDALINAQAQQQQQQQQQPPPLGPMGQYRTPPGAVFMNHTPPQGIAPAPPGLDRSERSDIRSDSAGGVGKRGLEFQITHTQQQQQQTVAGMPPLSPQSGYETSSSSNPMSTQQGFGPVQGNGSQQALAVQQQQQQQAALLQQQHMQQMQHQAALQQQQQSQHPVVPALQVSAVNAAAAAFRANSLSASSASAFSAVRGSPQVISSASPPAMGFGNSGVQQGGGIQGGVLHSPNNYQAFFDHTRSGSSASFGGGMRGSSSSQSVPPVVRGGHGQPSPTSPGHNVFGPGAGPRGGQFHQANTPADFQGPIDPNAPPPNTQSRRPSYAAVPSLGASTVLSGTASPPLQKSYVTSRAAAAATAAALQQQQYLNGQLQAAKEQQSRGRDRELRDRSGAGGDRSNSESRETSAQSRQSQQSRQSMQPVSRQQSSSPTKRRGDLESEGPEHSAPFDDTPEEKKSAPLAPTSPSSPASPGKPPKSSKPSSPRAGTEADGGGAFGKPTPSFRIPPGGDFPSSSAQSRRQSSLVTSSMNATGIAGGLAVAALGTFRRRSSVATNHSLGSGILAAALNDPVASSAAVPSASSTAGPVSSNGGNNTSGQQLVSTQYQQQQQIAAQHLTQLYMSNATSSRLPSMGSGGPAAMQQGLTVPQANVRASYDWSRLNSVATSAQEELNFASRLILDSVPSLHSVSNGTPPSQAASAGKQSLQSIPPMRLGAPAPLRLDGSTSPGQSLENLMASHHHQHSAVDMQNLRSQSPGGSSQGSQGLETPRIRAPRDRTVRMDQSVRTPASGVMAASGYIAPLELEPPEEPTWCWRLLFGQARDGESAGLLGAADGSGNHGTLRENHRLVVAADTTYAVIALVSTIAAVTAFSPTYGWRNSWQQELILYAIFALAQVVSILWLALRFIVQLRVGEWEVLDKRSDIRHAYLRSWFPLDLVITGVLIDWVFAGWLPVVFFAFQFRHVLRLGRLLSLGKSGNPLSPNRVWFEVLSYVIIGLSVLHTCAQSFAEMESIGYGDSVYWAVVTLTSVGYGDVKPSDSLGSRLFGVIVCILGVLVISGGTAFATSFLTRKDKLAELMDEKKQMMHSMLEYYAIPWHIQRDVIAMFPAVLEAHSESDFKSMVDTMPAFIAKKIEGFARAKLLRAVPLFSKLTDHEAIVDLGRRMQQRWASPQELIVSAGDVGREMFFLVRGVTEVLVPAGVDTDEMIVVACLRSGQFFGEIALIEDTVRTASVQAVTLCELLVLGKDDFVEVTSARKELAHLFEEEIQARRMANARAREELDGNRLAGRTKSLIHFDPGDLGQDVTTTNYDTTEGIHSAQQSGSAEAIINDHVVQQAVLQQQMQQVRDQQQAGNGTSTGSRHQSPGNSLTSPPERAAPPQPLTAIAPQPWTAPTQPAMGRDDEAAAEVARGIGERQQSSFDPRKLSATGVYQSLRRSATNRTGAGSPTFSRRGTSRKGYGSMGSMQPPMRDGSGRDFGRATTSSHGDRPSGLGRVASADGVDVHDPHALMEEDFEGQPREQGVAAVMGIAQLSGLAGLQGPVSANPLAANYSPPSIYGGNDPNTGNTVSEVEGQFTSRRGSASPRGVSRRTSGASPRGSMHASPRDSRLQSPLRSRNGSDVGVLRPVFVEASTALQHTPSHTQSTSTIEEDTPAHVVVADAIAAQKAPGTAQKSPPGRGTALGVGGSPSGRGQPVAPLAMGQMQQPGQALPAPEVDAGHPRPQQPAGSFSSTALSPATTDLNGMSANPPSPHSTSHTAPGSPAGSPAGSIVRRPQQHPPSVVASIPDHDTADTHDVAAVSPATSEQSSVSATMQSLRSAPGQSAVLLPRGVANIETGGHEGRRHSNVRFGALPSGAPNHSVAVANREGSRSPGYAVEDVSFVVSRMVSLADSRVTSLGDNSSSATGLTRNPSAATTLPPQSSSDMASSGQSLHGPVVVGASSPTGVRTPSHATPEHNAAVVESSVEPSEMDE